MPLRLSPREAQRLGLGTGTRPVRCPRTPPVVGGPPSGHQWRRVRRGFVCVGCVRGHAPGLFLALTLLWLFPNDFLTHTERPL